MRGLSGRYTEGIFIKECDNRFLCYVKISGIEELCYVPSSSHLSHFIQLENKKVLLKTNVSKNTRTKYSLFAVEDSSGYTLLNLNYVNAALEKAIALNGVPISDIKREKKTAGGFKADAIVNNEVFEAKAILSDNERVYYPSITVYRVDVQLRALIKLLQQDVKVNYCIFLLSHHIICVDINRHEKDIKRLMKKAIKLGMELKIYKLIWAEDDFIPVRDNVIEDGFLKRLMK